MEIRLDHIFFSNYHKDILNDVSLVAKSGNITFILGKSGSGKSTILNIIDALCYPKSGFIYIDQKRINFRYLRFNTYRSKIGYLYENIENQFTTDTVWEQFELSRKISISPIECNEVLKLVDLDKKILSRKIKTLSHSERKTVALASLIIKNPDVFLLDDPFLQMDPYLKEKWFHIIRFLKNEKNKNIIIVSQSTEDALQISDYIYILLSGNIKMHGERSLIFKNINKLRQTGLSIPHTIAFSDTVFNQTKIKIGYRNEINDLIKDIYRYVK